MFLEQIGNTSDAIKFSPRDSNTEFGGAGQIMTYTEKDELGELVNLESTWSLTRIVRFFMVRRAFHVEKSFSVNFLEHFRDFNHCTDTFCKDIWFCF